MPEEKPDTKERLPQKPSAPSAPFGGLRFPRIFSARPAGVGAPQPSAVVDPENAAGYRAYIEKIAGRADKTIIVSSAEHANITVEYIIRAAREKVEILTVDLNPTIYGTDNVCDAAVDFLDRDPAAKFGILCENDIAQEHPLFEAFRSRKLACRVGVCKVPEKMRTTDACHFIVSDGRNFRYDQDGNPLEATVQFGEASLGAALSEIFARLSDKCEVLPIRAYA